MGIGDKRCMYKRSFVLVKQILGFLFVAIDFLC